MNNKWMTLLMVILTGLFFLAVSALTAADKPSDVPDEIMIDSQGYKKDRKPPVKFKHKKHQDEYINAEGKKIDCTECHHEYKDEKNVWKEGKPVKKCATADCHNPLKKMDKRHKLQLAYHKNCKDCHKAVVKAGKKKAKEAPYKKCNQCMKEK